MNQPHISHVPYRVPYADTDQMGVVYYGNYLTYFERVRNQLLRDLGLPYADIERRGFGLPVIEAQVHYRAAAGYDDELDIQGWFAGARGARLRVNCAVYCRDTLLAEGHTVHALVDRPTMRPRLLRTFPELLGLCPETNDGMS